MTSTWTDDMATLAKTEWGKGASASAIATMIWTSFHVPLSRNAVIGKLHRLGLTRSDAPARPMVARSRGGRPRRNPQPTRSFVPKTPEALAALPEPALPDFPDDFPYENRKTILTVGNGDCRYIVGDVRDGDYFFCGEPQAEEWVKGQRVLRPYCEGHCRVCYGGFSFPQNVNAGDGKGWGRPWR